MESINLFFTKNLKFFAIASLTLGLAPFSPPHIVGKLEWLMGGAVGMKAMDWFDLFLHGTPWLLLITGLIFFVLNKVGVLEAPSVKA